MNDLEYCSCKAASDFDTFTFALLPVKSINPPAELITTYLKIGLSVLEAVVIMLNSVLVIVLLPLTTRLEFIVFVLVS